MITSHWKAPCSLPRLIHDEDPPIWHAFSVSGLTISYKMPFAVLFPRQNTAPLAPSSVLHVHAQASQTYKGLFTVKSSTEYAALLLHSQTHISLGEDHSYVF